MKRVCLLAIILTTQFLSNGVFAEGIIGSVVSSPLAADGTVDGARTGINIYLEKPDAAGIEFMNPEIVGYGVPPKGRIEIELVNGFERDSAIELAQPSIMMVTGTPQQGMPGGAIGYKVSEGRTVTTFVISPTGENGLVAEEIMSSAGGAKGDPIRQRGIKVVHVGMRKAFINRGTHGEVAIRIYDGDGNVVSEGSGSVEFLDEPSAQIFPTNFVHGQRNHNWQTVVSGEVVGHSEGSVPITLMLYDDQPIGGKAGLTGVGVLSTQQLTAMKYEKPQSLARYTGGLIVQDTSGDGVLDPKDDRIIGGVIGQAPLGAKGQELRSLYYDGVATLSRPTTAFVRGPGTAVGGAVMLLEFVAGDKPGLYRPTLALLRDLDDLSSEDGSSYTYTMVVK